MFLTKRRWSNKILAEKPCRLTSYIKLHGSEIPFTELWWIGPYIFEKVLPINKYLVRKIGTNKTQVLHRMRMRQFTPRQPLLDIRITPQEWKPDPKVSIKDDDLHARALGREYERPIFDAKSDNAMPPNSSEIAVQVDLLPEETWNTPGTARKRSREFFPIRKNYVT